MTPKISAHPSFSFENGGNYHWTRFNYCTSIQEMRPLTVHRIFLPWLLVASQINSVCLAQTQRSRRRHSRDERKKNRSGNGGSSSTFDFDQAKEKFGAFFEENEDTVQRYKLGPKHIIEGLWNTALVSGTATLVGFAGLLGFPIFTLMVGSGSSNTTFTSNGSTREKRGKDGIMYSALHRVIRLIVGGCIGGTVAFSSWTIGFIYGAWQIAVGLYRTPATIAAQIQGRRYYVDGTWQYYNLTEHADRLSGASVPGSKGKSVRDDSYYQILQVSTDAGPKDIKRAYYKLAKEYHPDKIKKGQGDQADISEKAANERFLKIHQAYETLYDPQKRKAYDDWGQSARASLPFDSNVFFDVLFGFSPELEQYIGDLAIKSFSSSVVQFVLAVQSASEGNSEQPQDEMIAELLSSFFTNDGRDLRQVEIALYLQEFAAQFVKGTWTEEQFIQACEVEAKKVLDSTPFPLFLKSIGKTLYWYGRSKVSSLLDLPAATMAWTREGTLTIVNTPWFPISFVRLVRQIQTQFAKATKWMDEEKSKLVASNDRQARNSHTDEEWKQMHFKKVMELLLPSIMEFVWDYNQRDIVFTLKGACWKLLHSVSLESGKDRRRQAKAIQILGSAFMKYSDMSKALQTEEDADEKVCHGTGNDGSSECSSSPPMFADQERVQRAVEMAMKTEGAPKSRDDDNEQ